jgi:ubiquinone/menaquinone biosynthesis C-methylase UbiE
MMELNEIKEHWDELARKHGIDLKSTTKTETIKRLEVNAFVRAINTFLNTSGEKLLLEVGCGNGRNIFELANSFPLHRFLGVDYSDDMINAAHQFLEVLPNQNIRFEVGDVRSLHTEPRYEANFNLVFTDRLLINLNSWELQMSALRQLKECLNERGILMILENFKQSYANQNRLREVMGLPVRTPDPYNKFIDEHEFENFVVNELHLDILHVENFGSLHDLLLYVLLPHSSSGIVDYSHPMMESVTKLLEEFPENLNREFGNFGQNKLYVLQGK